MKALALIIAALLSGIANAAYVPHDPDSIPPMQSYTLADGEIMGLVVCQVVAPYHCGEFVNFREKKYRFADYVRLKSGSKNARIIGYQYSPDDQDMYIYFAIPETDIPADYLPE